MVLINFILNYLELHPDKQVFFFSYEESRSAILSLFLNTYINQDISKKTESRLRAILETESSIYSSRQPITVFSQKGKIFQGVSRDKKT